MSTKIIENFNQTVLYCLLRFFTASAAKNRTIRLTTKPVNTFLEIIFRNPTTALFNRVFIFIKKLQQPSYTIHTFKKIQNKGRLNCSFRRPFYDFYLSNALKDNF